MASRRKSRRTIYGWVTDQSPAVKVCSGLAIVFGLIVAIPQTWSTVASPIHSYVDGRVDMKIGTLPTTVRDLQLEAAEGKLTATKNDQVKWEVELRKTKDQVTRDLINKQMRELENTRGRLEQQIKTLNAIRQDRP